MTRSLRERLLSKIKINEISGCWEWTAGLYQNGYGKLWSEGTTRLAHRISYELHCGDIPKGMHICHSCDNRSCANPEHLFLGTHTENMIDRNAKGRQARPDGTKNGKAKLTEADVLAIRAATGISQRRLAEQFDVAQSRISEIRSGKYWSHI